MLVQPYLVAQMSGLDYRKRSKFKAALGQLFFNQNSTLNNPLAMKTIVLAIDFEWQSTKILAEAKRYALAFNAHLHLVHVSTLVTKPLNYDPVVGVEHQTHQPELSAERRLLKQLCQNLKEEGVQCDFSILEGDVSKNLLKQSEKLEAELIIVGHHQRGFVMRALLKSTSEEALHNSNIPLLLIPLDN